MEHLSRTHMNAVRDTLTPEEIAAPTYLEWSDESIAKTVRALSRDMNDTYGASGLIGSAAIICLATELRDSHIQTFKATLTDGTLVMCRVEPGKKDE